MPSTLQRSRDILANGVARVRSGLGAYARAQSEPGPEIEVQPFDAQNVSTAAGLIKLGTSIAAARRKRANYDAAKATATESLELERDVVGAEIARLRSQSEADLRAPAAAATPAGSQVIGQGKYKGWTVRDAQADISDRRIKESGAARGDREKRRSGLSAARAALSQIDAQAKRETDQMVTALDPSEGMIRQAHSTDPRLQAKALQALGVSPEDWKLAAERLLPTEDGKAYIDTVGLIEQRMAKIRATNVARVRSETEQRYEPIRQRYRDVIEQEVGGIDPENPLGIEDDPLGVLGE